MLSGAVASPPSCGFYLAASAAAAIAAVIVVPGVVVIKRVVVPAVFINLAAIGGIAWLAELVLEFRKNDILTGAKLSAVFAGNANDIGWIDLDDKILRLVVSVSTDVFKRASMESAAATVVAVVIYAVTSHLDD